MKLHANAALTLNNRRRLVKRVLEEDWSIKAAALAGETSERTAAKWVARCRAEGELGLLDRPSAAKSVWNRTPEDRIEAICALRRLRFTGAEIGELLEMPETTVSGILTRVGLGRLGRLGLEPPRRYEKQRPGELIHVDVKKLGRIERGAGKRITGRPRSNPIRTDAAGRRRRQVGWEFVHVCVDDATRLAFVEVLPDEKGATAASFLRRAAAWFASMGITLEAVMSDNGACYRSGAHAAACDALRMRHLFTRPYRPRTNGKAERFIQTLTDKWAYGAIYGNSAERTRALPGWLSHYNFRRQHGSLAKRPPAARLAELEQRRG